MISVGSLKYAYSNQKEISFPEISVPGGAHCLLLGNSGSGKTTLLHLIGGLLNSQQGKIEVNGTDLSGLSESALDHFRGKNMGFIFQRNHLIAALSVRKNLMLAQFLAGLKVNENRVEEVLQELDLGDKKNSRISELSQGQAQRVAIARALINKPSVILADEPTSALDDANCDRVIELLLKASTQHQATLLVATHDQRLKSRIKNIVQITPAS